MRGRSLTRLLLMKMYFKVFLWRLKGTRHPVQQHGSVLVVCGRQWRTEDYREILQVLAAQICRTFGCFWSSFIGFVDGYSTWCIISAAFPCWTLTAVDCLVSELRGVKAVNVTSVAVRWLHPSHGARSTLSLVGSLTTLPLGAFHDAIHSDRNSCIH